MSAREPKVEKLKRFFRDTPWTAWTLLVILVGSIVLLAFVPYVIYLYLVVIGFILAGVVIAKIVQEHW